MNILRFFDKYKLILVFGFIIITAFALRSYGRTWDQKGHLHPDERMLIMVSDRIQFPSNLYPDFFNYGSLPIYLLKGSSQFLDSIKGQMLYANYDGMLILGRVISTIADMVTIVIVFVASQLLTKKKWLSITAMGIYAICVFPIQNSHFFVVDVFMNLFITSAITSLIWYIQSKRSVALIFVCLSMGAAFATKFTSIIFFSGILLSILLVTPRITKQSIVKVYAIVIKSLFVTILTLTVFVVSMPYAILPPSGILTPTNPASRIPQGVIDIRHFGERDYMPVTRFLRDIKEQTRMNNDAYVFPYTLQYVTTIPYVYYLEQIIRWGLGYPISIFCLIGFIAVVQNTVRSLRKRAPLNWQNFIIPLMFVVTYGLYFIIVGRSAVKFMRYMLPLYPMFAILAGYGLYQTWHFVITKLQLPSSINLTSLSIKTGRAIILVLIIFLFLSTWTIAFMRIYSVPHTRIVATDWIINNIPSGSTLAVEHWDDRVPVRYGERYKYQEMTIYEQPDDSKKWNLLMAKLKQSDYVILASNRLYTPLPKLADCQQFKSCYPLTSVYYEKLFNGSLGFKKIKEFTAYPKLGPFEIIDDDADESFTVYEHPKIIIFKRQ